MPSLTFDSLWYKLSRTQRSRLKKGLDGCDMGQIRAHFDRSLGHMSGERGKTLVEKVARLSSTKPHLFTSLMRICLVDRHCPFNPQPWDVYDDGSPKYRCEHSNECEPANGGHIDESCHGCCGRTPIRAPRSKHGTQTKAKRVAVAKVSK